jgi:hypothetical protein
LQQFGQGVEKVADTWGEIQKDSVLNNAIKEAEAETEKFSKLQGADALEAEQKTKDSLDQIADKYRSQLPANLAHQFDTAFRPYQYRTLGGKISTHAVQQAQRFTKDTNEATTAQAGDDAANNYNNPEAVDQAIKRAREGTIKQLQAEGNFEQPGIATQALKNSDSYVYARAAEAMFVHNAPEGAAYVEEHRKDLGARYTPLAEKYRARATEIASEQKSDVLRRIYDQPDPTIRKGLADANKAILGEATYNTVVGNAPPERPGNVVPLRPTTAGGRPGESEPDRLVREAKEKLEGTPSTPPVSNPSARLPGESRADWLKRHKSENYSPAQAPAVEAPGFAATKQGAGEGAAGAISAALSHTVDAHTDRNFFSSGAARRQGIPQGRTTIGDSQGHTIEVNEAAAPHFAGFLKELTDSGYKIKDIGGYSNRKIFGTNTYSEHAFGNAIDINPNENPQQHGGPSNMPANVREIAAKYGLIWGGDWRGASRDPMHFEWSGKGTQVAGQ